MRRVSVLVLLSALFAIAVPSAAIAAECPGADLRPSQDNTADVGQATLCLINIERAAGGLAALTEQSELTQASVAFSQLMVDEHFFAHVSPNGRTLTDRLEVSGYLAHPGGWTVGENIAWGESYLATPAEIVKAWMDSPPHKANILSGEFSEIGLGIAIGVPFSANEGATYTTDFGHRTLAPESPDDQDLKSSAPQAEDAAALPVEPRKRATRREARPRKGKTARSKRTVRRTRRAQQTRRNARHALSMRAIKADIAR